MTSRFSWLRSHAAVASIVALAWLLIAQGATTTTGVQRILVGPVVGAFAAMAVTKLWPRPVPFNDDLPNHLVFFLVAGIAIYDGVASFTGTSPLATWSMGAWSLPFGVLILWAQVVDYRKWRTARRASKQSRGGHE